MIILGVILLVAAAVVLVDAALTTNGTLDVHVLGWHLGNTGAGRALLLGAIIGVVLALGLGMVLAGQARSLRKRRERNRALKGTTAENRRLAAELDAQRARAHEAEVNSNDDVTTGQATTGHVDAYPEEGRRGGAEYVLGSKYPQETGPTTPPTPPSH